MSAVVSADCASVVTRKINGIISQDNIGRCGGRVGIALKRRPNDVIARGLVAEIGLTAANARYVFHIRIARLLAVNSQEGDIDTGVDLFRGTS